MYKYMNISNIKEAPRPLFCMTYAYISRIIIAASLMYNLRKKWMNLLWPVLFTGGLKSCYNILKTKADKKGVGYEKD